MQIRLKQEPSFNTWLTTWFLYQGLRDARGFNTVRSFCFACPWPTPFIIPPARSVPGASRRQEVSFWGGHGWALPMHLCPWGKKGKTHPRTATSTKKFRDLSFALDWLFGVPFLQMAGSRIRNIIVNACFHGFPLQMGNLHGKDVWKQWQKNKHFGLYLCFFFLFSCFSCRLFFCNICVFPQDFCDFSPTRFLSSDGKWFVLKSFF